MNDNLNQNNYNNQINNGIQNNRQSNNQNTNTIYNGQQVTNTNMYQGQFQTQTQPINNQINNMQTNYQEISPQINLETSTNNNVSNENKPKKKIGLIIGIVVGVIILIVLVIIFIPKIFSSNKEVGNSLIGNKEEITSKGKIPYNKEINSCALNNVEYKDNTRNLCENTSYYFTSKSHGLIFGYIDYTNITFYLNVDESDILSYKRPNGDLNGYKFISVFMDETKTHYIYIFYEMENDNYIYVTNPNVDKIIKDVSFANATTKELSNGKTIEKGTSSNAYRYNTKISDLDVSIIYLGEYNAEDAYNSALNFSKLLSMDDGSPFLFDLVISMETINDYYVKSYKYITKLSTEVNIRGVRYTDLHYDLTNNNITYSFSDTSSYMPDFFEKYDVHKIKMLSNDKIIHGTFMPEDNKFMIIIELIDKYYANDVDESLGAEYYINNYTEMFVSQDGKGFGHVEKHKS